MTDPFFVYTWKDGLLSRLGHDLRFTMDKPAITKVDGRIEVRCELSTLRFDTAMRDNRPAAGLLSDKDIADIHANLRNEVLHVSRYPIARFVARVEADRLAGDLELHGVARTITVPIHRGAGRIAGEIELVPSLWGIKPFKALLGALRIQDRVRVTFDLPETDF